MHIFTKLWLVLVLVLNLNCVFGAKVGYDVKNYYPNNRIIGGELAPPIPYMVALVFGDRVPIMLCGGSLVTTSHVLTAAHCIEAVWVGSGLMESFRGVVGTNTWAAGGVSYNFSHFNIHPRYDPFIIKNDVGILHTRRIVQLGNKVALVSLSTSWVEVDKVQITGWGQVGPIIEDDIVNLAPIPEYLQLLNVNSITSEDCIIRVNNASLIWGLAPPVDGYTEICTLLYAGKGACMGDSGSPVVLHQSKEQVGIVSWGFACALGFPDVHVRITGVLDFIESIIKS